MSLNQWNASKSNHTFQQRAHKKKGRENVSESKDEIKG